MKLHSQEVRKLAPENDPLKIGMGWSVADLDKTSDFSRKLLLVTVIREVPI